MAILPPGVIEKYSAEELPALAEEAAKGLGPLFNNLSLEVVRLIPSAVEAFESAGDDPSVQPAEVVVSFVELLGNAAKIATNNYLHPEEVKQDAIAKVKRWGEFVWWDAEGSGLPQDLPSELIVEALGEKMARVTRFGIVRLVIMAMGAGETAWGAGISDLRATIERSVSLAIWPASKPDKLENRFYNILTGRPGDAPTDYDGSDEIRKVIERTIGVQQKYLAVKTSQDKAVVTINHRALQSELSKLPGPKPSEMIITCATGCPLASHEDPNPHEGSRKAIVPVWAAVVRNLERLNLLSPQVPEQAMYVPREAGS